MIDCWNCGSPLICDECGKAAPPDGAIRADAESVEVVRAERERDEARAERDTLREAIAAHRVYLDRAALGAVPQRDRDQVDNER